MFQAPYGNRSVQTKKSVYFFPGVDPDSDEEAEEADPGLGNAGDLEDADAGSKVRQMVTSTPGPLLAQT